MVIRLRWLAIAFLFLYASTGLAVADTVAGVAAYDHKDYATALKLLKPEAENGDAEAQVKYGLIFAKGLGVPTDRTEAFKWFKKSAAQGNAEAMYCMGVAYDVGDADGGKNLAKAAEWYRKAADKRYAMAEFNLGQMLQSGDGIAADPEQSVEWLRKAAAQQVEDAEASLGVAYVKGLGVETNLLTARYWAERAAAHGSKYGKGLADALGSDFEAAVAKGIPRTTGGDGSSMELAIRLPDAKTEMQGVDAEYKVLHYFFPGYHSGDQALLAGPDHRPYDLLKIQKDGKTRDVYFDISNFYGKME